MDVFTLSALLDEWMDTLVGGRIQDVLDVDGTGFGLEVYANQRRHYLYLSADKQTPRAHLVPDKLRRGLERPSQLGLLLRRFAEGGRLIHIHQPPWERILHLEIEGPEGEVVIIVEPMPRRANILLLHDGVILDCVHRIGPEDNRYRLSLPNHTYAPPPPLTGRLDPFTISSSAFGEWLDSEPQARLTQTLTSRLLGISPLLARELCYRASDDVNTLAGDVDVARLRRAFDEILQPLAHREWQPGYCMADDRITAYAVFPITHQLGWQTSQSASDMLTMALGAPVGTEAYEEARKPVRAQLEEAQARVRAKLASLETGLRDDAERDRLQHSGELILAYQYQIKPGQRVLKAQYEVDGPELVIELDTSMTPLENAQHYFDKYNRAKRAQANVPQLIEATRMQAAYLQQLAVDLEQAINWPDIDDVWQALQTEGFVAEKRARRLGGTRSSPIRLVRDGYVIWVGRNSRQNEQVTFKLANSEDMWLHARGVPGSHVVIRNDGRRIPETLIAQVASVAAYYSSRRHDTKVDVDVTAVKHVRKIRGAGQGMVSYRNETTLTVEPSNEEILRDD